MLRLLISLLLLSALSSPGQSIQIDTLRLPRGKQTDLRFGELKFPNIRTGDKAVDSLINFDLKNRFTHNEDAELSADSALMEWAGESLSYLQFEVTYNRNGIISLNIMAEGCGAYCSSWTDYYNYSTITGAPINISEIIDTTGKFRELVVDSENKQFDVQRKELKDMLSDPQMKLEKESYEWALEHYENCENSFDLNSFALHADYLEIIRRCYLPHAIQNLTPVIELKYKYNAISRFLKRKL